MRLGRTEPDRCRNAYEKPDKHEQPVDQDEYGNASTQAVARVHPDRHCSDHPESAQEGKQIEQIDSMSWPGEREQEAQNGQQKDGPDFVCDVAHGKIA